MSYNTIIVKKGEGIAKIILNRPQALNAMNKQMREEVKAACDDAESDDSIKVIIFSGAGRAFCAGDDLKEMGTDPEPFTPRENRSSHKMQQAIEHSTKPVIAAVHGYCFTGALDIVLGCDIVIAAENAVIADTHARWGIIPGTGAAQRLLHLLGKTKAMELLLTCEPIDLIEAKTLGWVNKIVPLDELEQAAEEMANKIMKNDWGSVKALKEVLKKGMEVDMATGISIESAKFIEFFTGKTEHPDQVKTFGKESQ